MTVKATSPATSKFECGQFPRDMNPSGDCCIIPSYIDFDIERACIGEGCIKTNGTCNSTAIEKSTECYMDRTGLMVRSIFHKDALRTIISNNTRLQVVLFKVNPWSYATEVALTCKFAEGNITKSLINFHKCVREALLESCPWSAIDSRDECDSIEMFYENCNATDAKYCHEWHLKLMLPEFCCNCPELVSQVILSTCKSECANMTIIMEKVDCNYRCLQEKLKLENPDAVKTLLMSNAPKSKNWEVAIDKAAKACKWSGE